MTSDVKEKPPALEGAKGGGGHTPIEAPNTLRAKQIMHTIYALGEGPIAGPPLDGLKSVLIGEPPIPVQNSDGSFNFKGVTGEFRDGSSSQSVVTGVPAVESLVSVSVPLTVSMGGYIKAIDCTGISRLKFTLQVPALFVQTSEGDMMPTSVSYHVGYRLAGTSSSFATLFNDTINGKCVSPYQKTVIVDCPTNPGVNPFVLEFQWIRDTPDATDSKTVNTTNIVAVTTVVDRQLTYPNTALWAMTFDSEQFGGEVPTVTFDVDGKLMWVPTNYDPTTRAYATSGPGTSGGIWDGTFKVAYTNNPAWVFYTACTDTVWGLGRELGGAIDKWTLYAIAQYCDELVPNGFGGTEPRFTYNGFINSRDEAVRVLQSIAACFRGMIYWGMGQIVPVADMPTSPSKLVTPANVINGRFEYEGSSLKSRHNVVKVRWRDPDLHYRENIEVYQDNESIAQIGFIRETEYDAVGTTSRGQARRMAKWIVYSEKYESDMVRYKAFRDHSDVVPGMIISVMDPNIIGESIGGRLAANATTTTLVLDRKVTLHTGNTYSVRVQLPDGTISAAIAISNTVPSDTDTLTLSTPLSAGNLPETNYIWTLIVNNTPRYYRVMDVSEEQDETVTVTALRHYPAKYGFVEQDLAFSDADWTIYGNSTGPLQPPTGVTAEEYIGGSGITGLLKVTMSWTPSTDTRVRAYEVQAIMDGTVMALAQTISNTYTFMELTPGSYTFQVRALGEKTLALFSPWAATTLINVDGKPDAPDTPTTLSATGGVKNNVVKWVNPLTRHMRAVEVWAASTAVLGAATKVGESAFGSFVHSNLSTNATWYYWIRTADEYGQFSAYVGPVSATTSYLIANDIQDGILNTAKFAQSIQPVNLVTVLPGSGSYNGEMFYRTTDKTLWKWDTGTSSFVTGLTSDLQGRIIADQAIFGQIAAGAIKASQIAAGEINATHLAAAEIISDTIQVRNLIIGTEKLTLDSVTGASFSQASSIVAGSAGVWSQYIGTTIYTPDVAKLVIMAGTNGEAGPWRIAVNGTDIGAWQSFVVGTNAVNMTLLTGIYNVSGAGFYGATLDGYNAPGSENRFVWIAAYKR